LGVPIPTLTAALFARYQSEFLTERIVAATLWQTDSIPSFININELFAAYQLARIVNHHQGFHLVEAASEKYEWNIDMPELARIWTNGCIIRSTLMEKLRTILKDNKRILQSPAIANTAYKDVATLANIVAIATAHKIAIPCLASTVHYLLTYTMEQSSANIIQAQRDFFGAHTYQRKDDLTGKKYHTNWTND
jgi:6-phosphogluconate dehydrogenase